MMWADCAPGGNYGMSSVHVCIECTCLPFGRQVMMGMVVGRMLVAGVLIIRKWLLAPGSRMSHRLMVSASVLIVLRRIRAARAILWVGIGQGRVKLTLAFILFVPSSAPNRQRGGSCWYGV